MSKCGPKWQYFVWPPLFSSTALTLLGMEFTRASQVATGVLFHFSMTTSRNWWMFETLRFSTFRLRMPSPLIHLFPKHNLWIWRWAHALNFFGWPWRGLFWVEPVNLEPLSGLGHRATAQFQGLSNLIIAYANFVEQPFFFSDPQRVICHEVPC